MDWWSRILMVALSGCASDFEFEFTPPRQPGAVQACVDYVTAGHEHSMECMRPSPFDGHPEKMWEWCKDVVSYDHDMVYNECIPAIRHAKCEDIGKGHCEGFTRWDL